MDRRGGTVLVIRALVGAGRPVQRWSVMRRAGLLLTLLTSLFSGCDRPSARASYSPSEFSLFLSQTGLAIPANVEVLNYSSGLDERFLILRVPRSDVAAFIARLPVQPAAADPGMEGMAGKEFGPSWWRPNEIKASQYFHGQFTWKTRALGMVCIQVEDADPARMLVWVMKS